MAEDEGIAVDREDAFAPIANHYDAIMEHVDYGRWEVVAGELAALLPRPFRHLDVGCGTGLFMERLLENGWDSHGADLSWSMLRVARHRRRLSTIACADMRALPFTACFHLVTCLFDSLNFLLREEQVREALDSFSRALMPGGLLYFDMVTRQMITAHFEDQSWTENHGRFRSSWQSAYDREQRLCETRVRINSGDESVTRERVYPVEFVEDALRASGMTLLAVRDAYTWKKPGRRTTRLDFVVVKGKDLVIEKRFQNAEKRILNLIRG